MLITNKHSENALEGRMSQSADNADSTYWKLCIRMYMCDSGNALPEMKQMLRLKLYFGIFHLKHYFTFCIAFNFMHS